MNKYIFQKAQIEEIEDIFRLYIERIHWMDIKRIRQWNVTGYLESYPIDYYREQCSLGNLYVLKNTEDNSLAGAVVLYQHDERWSDRDESPAYYIHNLVTHPNIKGVGRLLIAATERLGIEHRKRFVRLDCSVDNSFLNDYYASKGYCEAGVCEEDLYRGIRREKELIS